MISNLDYKSVIRSGPDIIDDGGWVNEWLSIDDDTEEYQLQVRSHAELGEKLLKQEIGSTQIMRSRVRNLMSQAPKILRQSHNGNDERLNRY